MRQSGFAYAAKAAGTPNDPPSEWPDGWDIPSDVDPPGWSHIGGVGYWADDNSAYALQKYAVGSWVATPTAAVASGFAAAAADTPEVYASVFAGPTWVYEYDSGAAAAIDHRCYGGFLRVFYYFTPTAGTTALMFYFIGENVINQIYDNGMVGQPENWTASIYASTTSPTAAGLSGSDWAFGSEAATASVDLATGADDSVAFSLMSSGFTAGSPLYLQLRGDETSPSDLTGVTWTTAKTFMRTIESLRVYEYHG